MQLIIVLLIILLLPLIGPAHAQTVGAMDYNAVSGRFTVYNGSVWMPMGAALYLPLGACTKNGTIEYDALLPDLKYCGKGQWRSFSVSLTLSVCLTPGKWNYNPSAGKYQFCNGLVWVNMNQGTISLAGL